MNYENMNMGGMIQSGIFGTTEPIQQNNGYNPYNNIIPFGNYNTQQQYQCHNNNIYYGANYNNNNSVDHNSIAINNNYYNPYNNQYIGNSNNYYNPYGNQYIGNGNNYYSPYNNMYNNQQYVTPYGNNQQYQNQYNQYSYNNYNGYRPFYSPYATGQYEEERKKLFKMKYRLANTVNGVVDEERLEKLVNPEIKQNVLTDEEREIRDNYNFVQYVDNYANSPYVVETPSMRDTRILNLMSKNFHDAFDTHSLFTFLEEDLWKLKRDEWVGENINIRGDRNLSSTYNSNEYNELLNMHKSTNNPYINDLLSNTRYDNNIDDYEIGMQAAFDKERRRRAILEGKVPEFISSDEVQKRRHAWTQEIMNQIYNKGGKV